MYDSSVPRSVADQHFNTYLYALRRHLDFGRLIRVQCAGFIRAEASGEASVRGSSGERTCSGGARPEKGMGGFPGTGEVHGASRATPRNHATRVSTEPARSTPSRMTPAFTREFEAGSRVAQHYTWRVLRVHRRWRRRGIHYS